MDKKRKGFTLIEMVLVTVIIGILAGVVITVINVPRTQARSRDSRRIGDLKRVQSALERYFADNRKYPDSLSSWVYFCPPSAFMQCGYLLHSALVPGYIDSLPQDPLDGKSTANGQSCVDSDEKQHYYRYASNGSIYIINATMEVEDSADESLCSSISNCIGNDINCGAVGPYCYCLQNPM